MSKSLALRRGVRAVVVDDRDRVPLVRFEFPGRLDGVRVLWAAPGGRVEDGEDDQRALTRELAEEVGQRDPVIGPMIWTRTHSMALGTGHDGQWEAYYLVRTPAFEPAPLLTPEQLRAENVAGLRWWTVDERAAATDTVFVVPPPASPGRGAPRRGARHPDPSTSTATAPSTGAWILDYVTGWAGSGAWSPTRRPSTAARRGGRHPGRAPGLVVVRSTGATRTTPSGSRAPWRSTSRPSNRLVAAHAVTQSHYSTEMGRCGGGERE